MDQLSSSCRRRIGAPLLALVLVGALLAAVGTPAGAAATIWYVTPTGDGNADGTTWGDAFRGLSPALLAASAGDQIWVAEGTYTTNSTNQADSFTPPGGVSVYGGFLGGETALSQRDVVGNVTVLSGEINTAAATDNSWHVVDVSGKDDVRIDGFTITRGYADSATAPDNNGAGILARGSRNLILANLVIDQNTATNKGAGLFADQSTNALVVTTTLSNNTAQGQGGAVFLGSAADVDVVNTLIHDNSANVGGGMHVAIATASIINATIAENASTGGAGAGVNAATGSTVNVINTIVWDNTAASGADSIGGSATVANSTIEGGYVAGTNVIDADPAFVDPGADDFSIRVVSPGIDLGDTSAVPADTADVDDDGDTSEPTPDRAFSATRVGGSAVDHGAFEQAFLSCADAGPVVFVDPTATGDQTGLSWETAVRDLRTALVYAQCSAVEEFRVAAGVYTPHPYDPDVSFEGSSNLVIVGGFAPGGSLNPNPSVHETILSGDLLGNDNSNIDVTEPTRADNSRTVLNIGSGRTLFELRSLTIAGGNDDGLITASGVLVAGTFEFPSSLTLRRVRFEANAGGGRTLYARVHASVDIADSIFENNAGVNVVHLGVGSDVTIASSRVVNNVGELTPVLFNGASSGGLTLVNSVVADNVTTGGGAVGGTGTTDIFNTTIAGNRSGLDVDGGTTTVRNSIIWGNNGSGGNIGGSGAGSVVVTDSTVEGGWVGSGNITTDPQFVNPSTGDYSIPYASPAVNRGLDQWVPSDALDVDGDGDTAEPTPDADLGERIRNGRVDQGAFEAEPPSRGFVTLPTPCPTYDSRTASGPLGGKFDGGELRTIQVTGTVPVGQGVGTGSTCVPSGVRAVTVVVTAADAVAGGNLRLSASDIEANGGVVNYAANGLDNTNTVTIELSFDGRADIFANGGNAGLALPSTDVRVAVIGYHPDSGGDEYTPITPCAAADSRSTQGASGGFVGPFATGTSFPDVDVVGSFPAGQGGGNTTCGVPTGATAVVANLVATNPAGGEGTLSAATAGVDPSEPQVAFADLGMNNAATVIIPLQGQEKVAIDIDGDPGATTNLRLVVLGYYATGTANYVPVNPCAAFDSRSSQGASGSYGGARAGGSATTYQIAGSFVPVSQGGGHGGSCGVPAGASAVAINLVAINAAAEGNLQAYATGTSPTGGILNFAALSPAMNNANAVVIPLSAAGQLDVYVNTGQSDVPGATDVRGVVLGYYT
jgi:hypothetical protein